MCDIAIKFDLKPCLLAHHDLASYPHPGVRRGGERERLVHVYTLFAHALNLLTVYCVTEADDVYVNIKNRP